MLDVHPPHAPPHTWRDFFIHIATIVVGLLIAVGLEQTVEAIHEHHQRGEIREALVADARKGVQDSEDVHAFTVAAVQSVELRMDQIQQALATGKPLAPESPVGQPPDFAAPDDPEWKAIKGSGLVHLLTSDEVQSFNDIDVDVITAEHYHLLVNDDHGRVLQFESKFTRLGSKTPDFSRADRQDLKNYLDALAAARDSARQYVYWCQEIHGAQTAILEGKRDLASIQKAERNPW
jgi:hypothetical protein